MIESFLNWIQSHAHHAHWFIFIATLLAGMHIPISIDLLMIISAALAATVVPSHMFHLFFAMFLGCLFSAWIAYWTGRLLGPILLKWPFFSKLLSPKRIKKMQEFYEKRGHFAWIIGRFIPFGVRNALFTTSGLTRVPFHKFAFWEAIACGLWSIVTFSLYYILGKNIDVLYNQVKMVNLLIFILFSLALIGFIWYKKRKNAKAGNV